MRLEDTRRLLGPNLYGPAPAVITELRLDPGDEAQQAVSLYHAAWARLLEGAGLETPARDALRVRPFRGGLAVVAELPMDTLLAATEAAEWAALAAAAQLAGLPEPAFEAKRAEVAALAEAQRSPALLALARGAAQRGLPLLWDDAQVSLGSGRHSRSYPRGALPSPEAVPWEELRALPFAFVTGTNGKTTSARLLARMLRAAGRRTACTSTDGVTLDERVLERGDCTGPFAARTALLQPDAEVAVLETARGGILRRGLALGGAEVALITNVSDDHLGTYGIDDVPTMARVKAVVGHAVRPGGRVVLCADDALLRELRPSFAAAVVYFSLDAQNPAVAEHLQGGGEAWLLEEGWLVRCSARERCALLPAREVPIAYGGAAPFNVANALGAAAAAHALGVGDEAIALGLRAFTPTTTDNPGRSNLTEVRGVRILRDFAHNAEAIRAVLALASALRGAGRLTVCAGYAGDRGDDALREVAGVLAAARPDRVLLRELLDYLRGRQPGEVTALLHDELLRQGLPASGVERVPSEVAAVERSLADARPGDLLLLLVHLEREAVQALLDRVATAP